MVNDEKKRDVRKRILPWVPTATAVFFAAVALIVYAAAIEENRATVYLSVPFAALVPLAVDFLDKKCRLNMPFYVLMLIALHVVMAVDFGSAFGFYDRISWWDLAVHGLFGFWSCALFFGLYLRFIGRPANAFVFISVFLMTMGLAGLWEIWEFIADSFTGEDALRIQESVAAGHSPVFDTMTDMMIAAAGAVLFYVVRFLRSRLKRVKSLKE